MIPFHSIRIASLCLIWILLLACLMVGNVSCAMEKNQLLVLQELATEWEFTSSFKNPWFPLSAHLACSEGHEWTGITCSGGLDVTSIDLNDIPIRGTLPNAISMLKRLEVLNLARTHISGVIPKSFTQLTKLSHLDLNGTLIEINCDIDMSMMDLSSCSLPNITVNRGCIGKLPSVCAYDTEETNQRQSARDALHPQDQQDKLSVDNSVSIISPIAAQPQINLDPSTPTGLSNLVPAHLLPITSINLQLPVLAPPISAPKAPSPSSDSTSARRSSLTVTPANTTPLSVPTSPSVVKSPLSPSGPPTAGPEIMPPSSPFPVATKSPTSTVIPSPLPPTNTSAAPQIVESPAAEPIVTVPISSSPVSGIFPPATIPVTPPQSSPAQFDPISASPTTTYVSPMQPIPESTPFYIPQFQPVSPPMSQPVPPYTPAQSPSYYDSPIHDLPMNPAVPSPATPGQIIPLGVCWHHEAHSKNVTAFFGYQSISTSDLVITDPVINYMEFGNLTFPLPRTIFHTGTHNMTCLISVLYENGTSTPSVITWFLNGYAVWIDLSVPGFECPSMTVTMFVSVQGSVQTSGFLAIEETVASIASISINRTLVEIANFSSARRDGDSTSQSHNADIDETDEEENTLIDLSSSVIEPADLQTFSTLAISIFPPTGPHQVDSFDAAFQVMQSYYSSSLKGVIQNSTNTIALNMTIELPILPRIARMVPMPATSMPGDANPSSNSANLSPLLTASNTLVIAVVGGIVVIILLSLIIFLVARMVFFHRKSLDSTMPIMASPYVAAATVTPVDVKSSSDPASTSSSVLHTPSHHSENEIHSHPSHEVTKKTKYKEKSDDMKPRKHRIRYDAAMFSKIETMATERKNSFGIVENHSSDNHSATDSEPHPSDMNHKLPAVPAAGIRPPDVAASSGSNSQMADSEDSDSITIRHQFARKAKSSSNRSK